MSGTGLGPAAEWLLGGEADAESAAGRQPRTPGMGPQRLQGPGAASRASMGRGGRVLQRVGKLNSGSLTGARQNPTDTGCGEGKCSVYCRC